MKRFTTIIALSVLLLAITSHLAWSQLSIRPEIGYQFSLDGGVQGENSNTIYNGTTVGTESSVYQSLGQGIEFGASLDYKFCPYFTLELGLRYWDGSIFKYNNSYVNTISGISSTDNTQENLNLVVISLGDFYDFGCSGNFVPYLGLGLDMGLGGNIKSTLTTTGYYSSNNTVDVTNSTTSSNVAFGAYGELGAKYHLSSNFSVFGEIRIDALGLTPNKEIVNSYSVNGVNELGTLTLSQTETDYVKTITNFNYSSTSPHQNLAYPLTVSAWGINVGIVYNFGNWSKSSNKKSGDDTNKPSQSTTNNKSQQNQVQQQYIDIVYLKNGSVIKGTIIEQVPNVSLKIQTADGSLFVYQISEVDKITKELAK